MIPMMIAFRKLDGEDPSIVFALRCSYGIIQGLILLAVLYVYLAAVKISKSPRKDDEIFVSPPPQPFAPPDAKTQYTKTTIGEQAMSVAKKLITSTLGGICMTCGLHWYKGMVVGLAMQTIMGPLNLIENTFAKSVLLGGAGIGNDGDGDDATKKEKPRMFGEKVRNEITEKDEVVDAEGKLILLKKKEKTNNTKPKPKPFADLLLDTWDEGDKADIGPLVKALKKDNVNFKTKDSGWSPLMIMTAINASGANDAIVKMKSLGASATMTDNEGWNALHWAAFHGSVEGAATLMEEFNGIKLGLHLVKDSQGMTPLEHAVKEGNTAVAAFIKTTIENAIKIDGGGIADQEGIRKRK